VFYFFTKDIKKFFLNATVVCVLYKGTSNVNILDRKEYHNDFLTNYENAIMYLMDKLNTEYIIKKEREERLELPEEALREAVINAMVHRDYYHESHVQIDIYHNRVEISNYGKLLFDKKYLGTKSSPRNPLLMDLLLRAGYVEKVGSGIKRIKHAMKNYNLDYDIDADEFFTLTLFRKEKFSGDNVPKNVPKKERQKFIIQKIKNRAKVTKRSLASEFNVSPKTIQRDLNELKKNKKIRYIGSKKGGHWEIIK